MNREQTRRIVELANKNEPMITSEFSSVRRICDAAELVWGLWPDSQAEDGVGMLVVKGELILENIMQTNVTKEVGMTAIWCACIEKAEALKQVLAAR